MKVWTGFGVMQCHAIFWTRSRKRPNRPRIVLIAQMTCKPDCACDWHPIFLRFQHIRTRRYVMRFFRELNPFASHVAVAALAIATWIFLIVPLWRRWRPRLLLLSKNNLLKKRLAAATIVLLLFAVGLWTGWHKDAISARLSRLHIELTRTIPSPSPSPSPLTLTESSVEAMDQTPASWPPLVDQLRREGIELRDRGDTTNAIERLKEALDSEPDNAAIHAELAKTHDLMQLYDRANEVWRKLQEIGPSAGAAYELADRRLKLGMPTPAAAPIPTAPDSSSREVSTSPYGTDANSAKNAIKPR